MDATTIMILAFVAVSILCILGYLFFKKNEERRKYRAGKNGEKKVAAQLDRIAGKSKNKFRVIHDIYLPLYDGTTQVDHIVIGRFGVLAVETKALAGEIYGNEKDQQWVHLAGQRRKKFYNPLMQNKAHMDCIGHLLRKANVYRVNVSGLVVFSQKNVVLNISRGLSVIDLALLKKYFKKSRFKQDNGVDVERVYQTLMDARVTDREKIRAHSKQVQEIADAKH